MHLFDIDIPGKITFQESKTLTAGNKFATFDTREYEYSLLHKLLKFRPAEIKLPNS